MPSRDPMRNRINQRLHDAIYGVREQLQRVELWAAALEGFSEPIPHYEPSQRHVLSTDREHKIVALGPATNAKKG
jgi:hypothetical protein